MFKKRELRVSLDKKGTGIPEYQDPAVFKQKMETIFHQFESVGAKMFLGVCVYILLDTYRQTQIERAKNEFR